MNNVPNPIWRILFKYYSLSKIKIKYEDQISDLINTSEGVKQGGILSPHLFNFFMNDLLKECTALDLGANINGINLSILAYCHDILILSPSEGHCKILLKLFEDFSKNWKIDFNTNKSAALTLHKAKNNSLPNFILNNANIPNVQNVEYLGLPIGNSEFVAEFLEQKWKKVEKSFYSLYGLGCKSKMSSPEVIGFLYKQFCQSTFRYYLDLLFIGEKKISEIDIRQNLLLKRAFGIKKFARFRALLEAVNIETIEQMYLKHKIFFIKQIRQNGICNEILVFLKDHYTNFDQKNTSFCKQLLNVGKKIHIDILEYNPRTSLVIIDHIFKNNAGLVDSIKYVIILIKDSMINNQCYFHFFKILNDLLKVDFYK